MSFADPDSGCALCSRLAAFRDDNRALYPDFHNAPVPSFGALDASLLIVGLAPGLKGANQTGRPFTGDYAGELLYPTLLKYGFATGHYGANAGDGLVLRNARITNAVRCVPPQNKPVGAEVRNCRPFLTAEIAAMPRLKIVLALGVLAHNGVLAGLGLKLSAAKFGHGAFHELGDEQGRGLTLADSYHCSRYNTNTGRLTEAMFEDVFDAVKARLANG
jgi:uracil-DNA glycosylase family 4